tara:strand:+ start:1016 stop:1360 length:345 start_codon:yes stop_codon:yes gene_type:complete
MEFTNARYNQFGNVDAVRNGKNIAVPVDPDNTDYQEIQHLVDAGELTIEPYVEPEKGYEELRRGEYPDMGDQFDAIWKYIAQHREDGEVLGEDVDKELDKVLAVKAKYPKEEEE